MNWSGQTFIYCTKAKPFLYRLSFMEYLNLGDGDIPYAERTTFIISNEAFKIGDVLDNDFKKSNNKMPLKNEYSVINDNLNGLVVAKCQVKEAFLIKNECSKGTGYGFRPIGITQGEAYRRSGEISLEDLRDYAHGKDLYAYHLENVEPCELELSDFYEDEECTKPLKKAPQSYRFAYRQKEIQGEKEGFFNHFPLVKSEKVLIFSIHPEYCAPILNGEKDLELRTKLIKGVKAI